MASYGSTSQQSGWNTSVYPGNQPYPPPANQPNPPSANQPYSSPANQPYIPQGGQPYGGPQPFNPNQPPASPFQPGGYASPSAPEAPNLPPGVNIDMLPLQPDTSHPVVPAKSFDPVPGYHDTGFDHNPVNPPPAIDDPDKYYPKDRPEIKGGPCISEDEARAALLELSKKNCCWGNRAANNTKVQDMKSSNAYQYCLETFCEMRSTAWARTPYTGQLLDGPHNGQAPGAWEIPVQCPALFRTERVVMEVPHTASSRPCDYCQAYGWVRCIMCHGRGRKSCTSCHGSGRRFNNENCVFCHGSGSDRCITCHGNGSIKCKTCLGHRSLKWFIQLTVDWINHSSDHIADSSALPSDMLRQAQGHVVLQEQNVQVFPVTNCPEASINHASSTLIPQHASSFPNERRIMQRQTIRIIPVTEATGNYKGNSFVFYVYGFDKIAHTSEYPLTCCCGCTLL